MDKMYCSKCGTQIESTASFCYKCGNAINSAKKSTTEATYPISKKTSHNPFIKWIFIAIALQIGLIILSAKPGDLGGFAFCLALALTAVVLSLSILTVIKSTKYNNNGKTTGIIFIVLSSLAIFIIILAVALIGKNVNIDDKNNRNINTENTSDSSISQPKEDTSVPTVTPTNWDTFVCNYYGDIPIGLLDTPDATADIVQDYINKKLVLITPMKLNKYITLITLLK